jgi:hypothetical protein
MLPNLDGVGRGQAIARPGQEVLAIREPTTPSRWNADHAYGLPRPVATRLARRLGVATWVTSCDSRAAAEDCAVRYHTHVFGPNERSNRFYRD